MQWWRLLVQWILDVALLASAVWLATLLTRGDGARDHADWPVARIFLLALGLRLVAAITWHVAGLAIGPRALVLDDESAYDLAARDMLRALLTPGSAPSEEWEYLQTPFLSFLAALYGLAGGQPLATRLVGALLGAATAILGASIARALYGARAATWAGIALAVFPSLVAWSGTALKEPIVTAFAMLGLWSGVAIRRAPLLPRVILSIACVILLFEMRLYMGVALAGALLVPVLARFIRWANRRRFRLAAISTAAAALAAVVLFGPIVARTPLLVDPSYFVYLRTVGDLVPPPVELLGQSAVGAELAAPHGGRMVVVQPVGGGSDVPAMLVGDRLDVSIVATSQTSIAAVPPDNVRPIRQMDPMTAWVSITLSTVAGVWMTLVAPSGSDITSFARLGLAIDALLWLAVLAAAGASLWRVRPDGVWILVAFAVLTVLALGFVPGNVGNLVRHRATLVVPELLVIASPFFAHLSTLLVRQRDSATARRLA